MLGKAWLVAVSLFFYAYWNPAYIHLLLGSILFNFSIGNHLASDFRSRHFPLSRRSVLTLSIGLNLALLGYFKYTNFLVDNINGVFGAAYVVPQILLPLGISFFTFTQIAYLVDSYRGNPPIFRSC